MISDGSSLMHLQFRGDDEVVNRGAKMRSSHGTFDHARSRRMTSGW